MGPRVPFFVSNPFGAISPNKVVETEMLIETNAPEIAGIEPVTESLISLASAKFCLENRIKTK